MGNLFVRSCDLVISTALYLEGLVLSITEYVRNQGPEADAHDPHQSATTTTRVLVDCPMHASALSIFI